ncbi:hypothetical protein N9K91_06520 [Schleiferiaceae bacterium]|nr:hypothetical protein [Schleiferiaceae bacterium]
MRKILITCCVFLSIGLIGQIDSTLTETLTDTSDRELSIQLDSTYVDSTLNTFHDALFRTVSYNKGYFISEDGGIKDSLTLLLDDRAEEQLWLGMNWNWSQRQNSAIGGITYDPLNPIMSSNQDGWHQFSKSFLKMPEFHSASAPRTDLKLLTGIGGGQVFGLSAMSPIDSAKQFYLDYLRSNALGLYRNEGSDGHELNIKIRQDGAYEGGKLARPLQGVELRYFNLTSGQNGGLSNPLLFETNVPTLRANYAIEDNSGALFEEQFELKFYRVLNHRWRLNSKAYSKQWSVKNDTRVTEYFWDSTGTSPLLANRNLAYNDSLKLSGAQVGIVYERLLHASVNSNTHLSIHTNGGYEILSSNTSGLDGYRLDSIHPMESFDASNQPFLRNTAQFSYHKRDTMFFKGRYSVNVIGFNAGGYDIQNKIGLMRVPGQLCIAWNVINQPQMFRFEQLYGYSYDLRNIEDPYFKNEIQLDWTLGDFWKKEFKAYGAQIKGLRYLGGFSELATWDGSYGRAQIGLGSYKEGINIQMQGYATYKSSVGGFATPNWGGFTEFNYKKSVGSKFQFKAGVNVSVEDAFYTPTYLIGVPIWSLQEEHLAGLYPWSTIYFEARIANFIGGIRVVNALEGLTSYNYFAFGATPRSDRWIQLSARWSLFN